MTGINRYTAILDHRVYLVPVFEVFAAQFMAEDSLNKVLNACKSASCTHRYDICGCLRSQELDAVKRPINLIRLVDRI